MNILYMKYFIQLCHDKSMNKAAKNLYISQQGLSRVIKNMEKEFQVTLFERSVQGVTPTKYGKIMLEKYKNIVSIYDELLYFFHNETQNEYKNIAIGISNFSFTEALRKTISKFQSSNTDITLEFFELSDHNCEKYLEDNIVDICLTTKPENLAKFDFIPACEYKLFLLINKQNPLCNLSKISIIDLKNERFILLSSESCLKTILIGACLKAGFVPKIALSTCLIDFIIEEINDNMGIAILPEYVVPKLKKLGDEIFVTSIEDLSLKCETGFLVNKGIVLNERAIAFIECYLEKFQNS